MRPRTTGISATVGQQQQQPPQNFKPKSEWKHENEASFLFVYLPGFAVDQLTITPDYSNRTVKVAGQRRLPNNRELPVDETFNIPEDCDLSKMDKQFGRGILMLKMPRNTVIPQLDPQAQQSTKETEEEIPKSQEIVYDSKTTIDLPKETSTSSVDKQSPDISSRVSTTIDEKNDDTLKETKPKGPKSSLQNVGVKEEESKAQSKETDMTSSAMSVVAPNDDKKESDKSPKSNNAKGKEVDNENANGSGKGKKGMVKNEDRKLIMNMGAAVLIIMGLGASLLYTMGHKLAG